MIVGKGLPCFSFVKYNVDLQFAEMAAGLPTGTGKINKETLGLIMTSQALLPDGLTPSPNVSIFNSRQNQNESEKSRCATALRVRSQILAWYSGFLGSCNWFCLILTHAFAESFHMRILI